MRVHVIVIRGESKPERRSDKRIIAGTAFRLEFLVGWYCDADATMAVPELYQKQLLHLIS